MTTTPDIPQGPLLLIDGAGTQPFVGIWQDGQWLSTHLADTAALDGIFTALRHCLATSQLPLDSIRAFIHNEGPGSVLGIRVAAMAIRTWRAMPPWQECPVFAYRSLHWLAAQLQHTSPFTIITDYRKDAWLALLPDSPEILPLGQQEVDRLTGPLYYLPQRKAWRPPPPQATQASLDLSNHPQLLKHPGLLQPVPQPIAYAPHQQDYKIWNAERHRG